MIRVLLYYIFPLLLPMALYVAWVMWAKRRTKEGEEPPQLGSGPWFWLILAGFALMVASLSYVAITSGHKPGGTYYPPRLEDGRVIPAEIK